MRRTKIVCTIGPASSSTEVLGRLVDAGMDVARLNFSHGTLAEHRERLERVRSVSDAKGRPVAILQDLPGPKVRLGEFENGTATLQAGQSFVLTADDVPGSAARVSVSYENLAREVAPGARILVADGAIELAVRETRGREVVCEVLVGGEVSSRKGMNLPGSSLSVAAFTEQDRAALAVGLRHGVDYVAVSFVRRPEDVLQVQRTIRQLDADVPVIAKIEKHEALESIDAIVEAADGVMVARGDLAVETALERVPVVQKRLIRKCNLAAKPVITATQMLGSMAGSPLPTRAEANDVANAVLDGTDAMMLSEETAVGKYAVRAVETMARIIEATEECAPELRGPGERRRAEPLPTPHAVVHGTVEIARVLRAAAIVTPTDSGSTARLVGASRPAQPILALSRDARVVRRLALIWGVHPMLVEPYASFEEMIARARAAALRSGLARAGDKLVISGGLPFGVPSATNLTKVEEL
jgi:pyruvate kinase